MDNSNQISTVANESVMLATGCSNEDSSGPDMAQGYLNRLWREQTKKQADAMEAVAILLATAPNKLKRENFRAAYINYIETFEKLESRVINEKDGCQVRVEFERTWEEGKAEVRNLDSNQNFES